MLKLVVRKIYSGSVLEIQTYLLEKFRKPSGSGPNPRFKDKESRQAFMLARSRRKFERMINENFTPAGFYCTLTFDREYECHTVEETNYYRNLYTRRLKRKYQDAKIVSVIGKGKKTDRYHMHALIEGVPEDDISSKWTYGDVKRVEPLREHNFYDGVDHGRDYTALANYMLDHWTPDQGTHKWKATRNLRQPEVEVTEGPARPGADAAHPDPEIPEPPEGYILVEAKATKYGFNSFKYVKDPKPKRQRDRKEKRKRQRKKKESSL